MPSLKGLIDCAATAFGGIVAFEVARLLVAAGKKVELVVMIDPPTVNANRSLQLLFATMRRARPLAGHIVESATALDVASMRKAAPIF